MTYHPSVKDSDADVERIRALAYLLAELNQHTIPFARFIHDAEYRLKNRGRPITALGWLDEELTDHWFYGNDPATDFVVQLRGQSRGGLELWEVTVNHEILRPHDPKARCRKTTLTFYKQPEVQTWPGTKYVLSVSVNDQETSQYIDGYLDRGKFDVHRSEYATTHTCNDPLLLSLHRFLQVFRLNCSNWTQVHP